MQTISIMGRCIPYHVDKVSIDDLLFLPDNPRIYHRFEGQSGNQDEIYSTLCSLGATRKLIDDIFHNGGVVEEILVSNGVVIEGNSRLAAYRFLSSRYPEQDAWRYIPAKVIDTDLSDEERNYILASYHIKGKTSWDAFEKAAFVYRSVKTSDKKPKELAAQFGHHLSTIDAMAKAYETLVERYLPIAHSENEEQSWREKYSYFEAFFRTKWLRERAHNDSGLLDDFCEWVYKDVFRRAENVRSLPKILMSDQALSAFEAALRTDPTQAFPLAMKTVGAESKDSVRDSAVDAIRALDLYLQELLADEEGESMPRAIGSADRLRFKRIAVNINKLLNGGK